MVVQYCVQTENLKTKYAFEVYRKTEPEALASARSAIESGLSVTVTKQRVFSDGRIESKAIKIH
jgi:hypothetical protein